MDYCFLTSEDEPEGAPQVRVMYDDKWEGLLALLVRSKGLVNEVVTCILQKAKARRGRALGRPHRDEDGPGGGYHGAEAGGDEQEGWHDYASGVEGESVHIQPSC